MRKRTLRRRLAVALVERDYARNEAAQWRARCANQEVALRGLHEAYDRERSKR